MFQEMAFYFNQLLVMFCLVSLTLTFPSPAEDEQIQRNERDFLGLCLVVSTYTGQNCLNYLGYGCYCGIGGNGQAVDGVDECCRQHDTCYGRYGCDDTYFVKNKFDCRNKSCICQDPPTSGCPYDLCQCDVVFGECLSNVKHNKTFANYDKSQCAKA